MKLRTDFRVPEMELRHSVGAESIQNTERDEFSDITSSEPASISKTRWGAE